MEDQWRFGVVDYCFFSAVLLMTAGVGGYFSFKGSKSSEEFFMGNRAIHPIPIALSLASSFVSVNILLGFPGEAYAHGTQIGVLIIGMILGVGISIVMYLPVLYDLKIVTPYEYLRMRFKSRNLHAILVVLNISRQFLVLGINLFAPAIALTSITPIDYTTYICVLGVMVTLYSSFGGIKAVVWTDVVQTATMFLGLFTVIVVGCVYAGGIGKVWKFAEERERLEFFNLNPSPAERHSLYNVIIFGFTLALYLFSVSSINIQRICAVSSLQNAIKSIWLSLLVIFTISCLCLFGGLVALTVYADCDPLLTGSIRRKEEIMPYYVLNNLSFFPGLTGIYVAVVIGGSMSTISSILNGIVAIMWRDCFTKFDYFKNGSEKTAVVTNKLVSLVVGALLIGMAFITSKAKDIVTLAFSILGVFMGPSLGVFSLGMFFPKCNSKGAFAGASASVLIVGWISIGSMLYSTGPEILQVSTDNCSESVIVPKTSLLQGPVSTTPHSLDNEVLKDQKGFTSVVFNISYTLHTVLSLLVCFVIGTIVSYLTGGEDLDDVDPACISPVIRKFYWTDEEVQLRLQHKSQLQRKSNLRNEKTFTLENLREAAELAENVQFLPSV